LAVAREGYRPNQVVAAAFSDRSSVVPLLAERPLLSGQPTAYVCQNFACQQPVIEPLALRGQLQ